VLTGVSFAADEPEQGPPATSEERPWHHKPGGPGMGPLLHGEHVVRTPEGEYREVVLHNGTIEDVDAGSITVTSEDGYTQTYAITDDTTIRIDRAEATADALAVGQSVRVAADSDGAAIHIGSLTEEGEEAMAERRGRFQEFREQHGELREQFGEFRQQFREQALGGSAS
jgi:hypothetical protein